MKNYAIYYLLLLCSIFACKDVDKHVNEAQVTFKIAKPIEDAGIVIEAIEPNASRKIDKITMGSGKSISTYINNTNPTLYQATLFERQTVNFVIGPDDKNVTVEVLGSNESNKKVKVTGSKESERFYQVTDLMNRQKQDLQNLNERYVALGSAKREVREKLEREFFSLKGTQQKELINLIKPMDGSIVPIIASEYLNPDSNFGFLSDLSKKIAQQLPNSIYAKTFTAKIEAQRKLAVGSPAPEISLSNTSEELVPLSSMKGKYVLIDFWASWCKPCRVESPLLVSLYKKYQDKGFEIYSVSLDRKKADWVKAIKKDQLDWTHVSDLNYFNSAAAVTYKIDAIPATYLVNPEGVIIAKNLRGNLLADKLADVFK